MSTASTESARNILEMEVKVWGPGRVGLVKRQLVHLYQAYEVSQWRARHAVSQRAPR